MALNTSGAFKSPVNNANDSSFPGLTPTGPEATTNENAEKQENELVVLAAIYGEDFVNHTNQQGAWKKTEPTFDIHIKASSDEDFSVTLGFVMNVTYPKTPPILTIKNHVYLREVIQFKIQKFIENQPRILAQHGQEMCNEIVEGVRNILEDAAQAKAQGKHLPSLEEERERHEAAVARIAQEQKEAEERKKAEESKEEERIMATMLQNEIDRKRRSAKESRIGRGSLNGSLPLRPSENADADSEELEFDQFCSTTDRSGNTVSFKSVTGRCDPRKGQVTVVHVVRPVLSNGQGSHTMALKEAHIRSGSKDLKEFKKQLQSLESKLQNFKDTKGLQHRHLVEVLDFKVESDSDAGFGTTNSWTVSILTPLADKGSLEELLDLAGRLDIGKLRSWTRDLLDALNFMHNKNISHQDIHPGNILLFRDAEGEIIPKISDISYQRELHNIDAQKRGAPGTSAKSAYWLPPEIAGVSKPQYTFKTDIWDFGVVFAQMIFGLDVLRNYSSPKNLMDSLTLSHSLHELVSRFFKEDKNKRPRAFELGSSEFLATDASVFFEDSSGPMPSALSLNSSHSILPTKLRRDSVTRGAVMSRYAEDFVEEGRLGKGGFGEVVKARKKLDGQIYAIKKVTQRSQTSLTEILKEVRLLSRLSHPAVVRYYNTWVEEVPLSENDGDTSTDDMTEETDETGSAGIDIQFTSTGGLDYMSSNAIVEFGYDDESDEDEDEDDTEEEEEESSEDEDDTDGRVRSPAQARHSQFQRPFRTILYISMEYCEKRTLHDLISRQLYKNTPEIWRLFRQILEGLAHIHGLSIVHRDLKPANVFISSSTDGVDNVKIGDFGLATSGQFSLDKAAVNTVDTDEFTKSIGTASYAAPEVRSAVNGMYSTKVDMYSLGIIFFEMCYMPMMHMQKADVIGQLRRPKPVLPSDFKPAEKVQAEIVLSLISHNPKERPSSADLLKSGKLPVQMESETIRRTLAGLADPSSPYYRKMLTTLFATPMDDVKDYAYDSDMSAALPSASELLNQCAVKQALVSIFRRHGALEAPRSFVYPGSSHYEDNDNVVRLLDQNGAVLQLPYDLTLGHARMMAKSPSNPVVQRSFTFGSVFRDRQDTGQPNAIGEVHFDIVTVDTLDLALKEAEILKVLDEIIFTFPSTSSSQMCFHVGHSDLLQLIFEYCGVEPASRKRAAEVLSTLNMHGKTWQKIRVELRSPTVGISSTSVDELQRFDFRDTPNKAFSKLKMLFEGSDMYQRASSTIAHLKEVAEYTKRFGVGTKLYINPLNSLKESFFAGGILFSCVYDKKVKDVFAAGGRYDHLIKEQRHKIGGHSHERHAVGFNLGWERLARLPKSKGKTSLKKVEEEPSEIFSSKRCDALIASFDGAILRSAGVELLQILWAHDISAEIAKDARSPEDLMAKHRDESYSWIIIIKQDNMLKVKSMGRKDIPDADIPSPQLLSWLRSEIRERDSKAVVKMRGPSGSADTSQVDIKHDQDVKVLVGGTKSKKFNRRTVVEQAQVKAAGLMETFLDGPILAVETSSDIILKLVQSTKLSDPESWKKVEHGVTYSEKKYVREMHDQLGAWRLKWENQEGSRHSFLYNFRTQYCLYYDLSA